MILPLHILIALSSVIYSTYTFASPTRARLNVSYLLIALTVITGTYLTIMHPAHLTETCITGIIYISIVSAFTGSAAYKLAQIKAR